MSHVRLTHLLMRQTGSHFRSHAADKILIFFLNFHLKSTEINLIFNNSLAGELKLDINLSKENLVQNYHQQVAEIHHHQSWHQWNKDVCPIKVYPNDLFYKIGFEHEITFLKVNRFCNRQIVKMLN